MNANISKVLAASLIAYFGHSIWSDPSQAQDLAIPEIISEPAVQERSTKSPGLTVPGAGMTQCEEVIKVTGTGAGHETTRRELEAWTEGFLTGLMLAAARREVAKITEIEGTPIMITYDSSGDWDRFIEHCQRYRLDTLAQAALARWDEIDDESE